MRKFMMLILILIIDLPLMAGDSDSWMGDTHGYFKGGAGGFEMGFLELDLPTLNDRLQTIGLAPLPSQMYLTGGGGWGYVGNNIRVGGLGIGGQCKSYGKPGEIAKEVKLGIGFGGFLIEKAFHPFNKTELYLGAVFGGGSADITIDQSSGALSWDEMWNRGVAADSVSSAINYHNFQMSMNNEFAMVMPSVGLRYNVLRWCALGVNVGYLYTYMDDSGWEMDGKKIYEAPSFDFSNLFYRVNIYFGG